MCNKVTYHNEGVLNRLSDSNTQYLLNDISDLLSEIETGFKYSDTIPNHREIVSIDFTRLMAIHLALGTDKFDYVGWIDADMILHPDVKLKLSNRGMCNVNILDKNGDITSYLSNGMVMFSNNNLDDLDYLINMFRKQSENTLQKDINWQTYSRDLFSKLKYDFEPVIDVVAVSNYSKESVNPKEYFNKFDISIMKSSVNLSLQWNINEWNEMLKELDKTYNYSFKSLYVEE